MTDITIAAMTAEIDALRQKVKDLGSAAYLSQAHALCNDLGIAPGHIENRLFEAIGKIAILMGRREPFGYVDPDTLEFKHSKDEHRRGATVWPVYLRETE